MASYDGNLDSSWDDIVNGGTLDDSSNVLSFGSDDSSLNSDSGSFDYGDGNVLSWTSDTDSSSSGWDDSSGSNSIDYGDGNSLSWTTSSSSDDSSDLGGMSYIWGPGPGDNSDDYSWLTNPQIYNTGDMDLDNTLNGYLQGYDPNTQTPIPQSVYDTGNSNDLLSPLTQATNSIDVNSLLGMNGVQQIGFSKPQQSYGQSPFNGGGTSGLAQALNKQSQVQQQIAKQQMDLQKQLSEEQMDLRRDLFGQQMDFENKQLSQQLDMFNRNLDFAKQKEQDWYNLTQQRESDYVNIANQQMANQKQQLDMLKNVYNNQIDLAKKNFAIAQEKWNITKEEINTLRNVRSTITNNYFN